MQPPLHGARGRLRRAGLLLAAAGVGVSAAVSMIAWAPASAGEDSSRLRSAVQAGQIAPLENLLSAVRRDFNGQIIEIELESESTGFVYKVKLLGPQGHVSKLEYDARSLALLRTKGDGVAAARKR
ncbi:MAG TPA: hypothetical protein PKA20_13790 [Burkholderiaceae bacterium]|nr:hypothetical protein [Burkholderiaceae bacterium]